MAYKIQIKNSLKAQLTALDVGEFCLCTDTMELFVGTFNGNMQLGTNEEIGLLNDLLTEDKSSLVNAINNLVEKYMLIPIVKESEQNGNILINNLETKVYNDTEILDSLNGKSSLDHTHSLSDLEGVEIINTPSEGDLLSFNNGLWKPTPFESNFPPTGNLSSPYLIELSRWNIFNDGTNSLETTNGINNAINWAKSQGINHVFLPIGYYKLNLIPFVFEDELNLSFTCINMVSDMHFEMAEGCILELEGNGSPGYSIFQIKGKRNVKISGGKIIGDRKTHFYELEVRFERGGINPDGSLNDDTNYIRSHVIDRYDHPGLLNNFRLWEINGINVANGYSFYQYKDTITRNNFVGFRDNGGFAPLSPTGRGWLLQPDIDANNKMIFTIDISNNPLSEEQVNNIQAKVDNGRYTHEWGQGIEIAGSNYIEIDRVEICNCTGDAISTGWLKYHSNPNNYTQEQMGNHVYIHDCNLHHCRRQGITLAAANDVIVYKNKIHHIGKDDDGISTNFRSGIPPMFGIDIESMVGESNIPYKFPYYNRDGFELNFRIFISNNHIFHNERGHIVNADGNHVTVSNNIFEGWNVGGISSYPTNMYIMYLDNTLLNTELVIKGDDYVSGIIGHNSNIKLMDVRGASIQNIRLKNGLFYGNANYGYFGSPSINVETSTFTVNNHNMGNTAKVIFEQWVGKVPTGISVDKIYYVTNRTANTFQISETENGNPVIFYDSGEWGFSVNRYEYGRCYINNVVVERDWNTGGTNSGFGIVAPGCVIKNVTIKNHLININGNGSNIYLGRPLIIDGLKLIDSGGNVRDCYITNSEFIRNRSKSISPDLRFGEVPFMENKVQIKNCSFKNIDVILINSIVSNSSFYNVRLAKSDNISVSQVIQSYLERSTIDAYWLEKTESYTFARNTFNNVTTNINRNPDTTILIDNIDIKESIADLVAPTITVNPIGGLYNFNQSVNINTDKPSTIYYTLNGLPPTVSSNVYTSPISITDSTTLNVMAVDSFNNQSKVKSIRYNIDKIPPSDVTNLTAVPYNDRVVLSWDPSSSSDVKTYAILTFNGSSQTTATSFIVDDLLSSTQYTFSIVAIDVAGNRSNGTSITVSTTEDSTPPVEISNLTASSITSSTIGLTWVASSSSDLESYEILLNGELYDEGISFSNYCITGLLPDHNYTITVIAKDTNGNSSNGVSQEVRTATNVGSYVKDGLIYFQENLPNTTIVPNPNSYFLGNEPFTLSFTTVISKHKDLIGQYQLGGTQNKLRFHRDGNSSFKFDMWGENNTNFSIQSPNYADETIPYHIVIVRNNNSVTMLVNNNIVRESTLNSSFRIKQSTLPLVLGSTNTIIKNIAYYNRALTESELSENFVSMTSNS
ncbi:chitobiase/beta-hexosaminidase C-terminal domain-containing protein [Bacillus haimaensis]|uniref:chitobiase/beta-hexosaminidase C-terminal domain-containing protein n=1 Tax=Bacillus haimaensis TaxID=3160967 RepID=UPI003AA84CF6